MLKYPATVDTAALRYTFAGHVLPGSFFLVWSTWWLVSILRYVGVLINNPSLVALSLHIPQHIVRSTRQGRQIRWRAPVQSTEGVLLHTRPTYFWKSGRITVAHTHRLYMRSSRQAPYRSRAWFPLEWGRAGKLPLEPALKVLLTFIGINAELWAGHTSYRCCASREIFFVQERSSSETVQTHNLSLPLKCRKPSAPGLKFASQVALCPQELVQRGGAL
jgi:hypothetical protein